MRNLRNPSPCPRLFSLLLCTESRKEKKKKKGGAGGFLLQILQHSSGWLHSACLLQPSLNNFMVKQQCTDSTASETDPGFLLANKLTNITNILYESLGGGISSLFSMSLKCKVSTSANAPIFCCLLGHRGQSCLVFVPKSIDCIRHRARAFERKAP